MQLADAQRLSSSWLRLRHRIERVVPLSSSSIELGGKELPWLRVAEPDCLLDLAADTPKDDQVAVDPFWAATWRAARGLDGFLQGMDVSGKRLLELGCGSGQAGVGAAMRGAHVTMTDAVGLALLVARLNAFHVWGQIRFKRLRWMEDSLAESFPVIIGSDLVYDPNLFEPLCACARSHLQTGGVLLLSEPHRHTGDKFSKWVIRNGWEKSEHDIDLGDGRVPIRIFECRPIAD